MCNRLIHRGPDSEGYYNDDSVGLGVRRLRIIDLRTGDQPIHNEDSSIWVVFNGEIYNFQSLRKELESLGHRFYTQTDTEVIVHLYEEMGERCVDRLDGMFAFALWDGNLKQLLLARDRFGKKPLHYTFTEDVFLFSSEIKPLLEFECVSKKMDMGALNLYLTFFYVPAPLTLIERVYKLLPGHIMTVSNIGIRERRYWDPLVEASTNIDEEAALKMLDKFLTDAVSKRLVSDVPLGVLLSGGVDSSIIASVMSRLRDLPLSTFSIGFHEQQYNELRYARMVAESIGADHHEFILTPDIISTLPVVAYYLDEPIGDPAALSMYYVCRKAREFVTVTLTGDGGDENFWGYPWFEEGGFLDGYFALPSLLRKPLTSMIAGLPSCLKRGMIGRAYSLVKYESLNYGRLTSMERQLCRFVKFTPHDVRSLYGSERLGSNPSGNPTQHLNSCLADKLHLHGKSAIAYVTYKSFLPNYILHKVDRMSMASSLEARCPLLDIQLSEFAMSLPSPLKVSDGIQKYILKRYALRHLLLDKEFVMRKKVGFPLPVEYWFRRDLKHFAEDQLLKRSPSTEIFNRDYVEKMVKSSTAYENAVRVFALLILHLWYESIIGSTAY